MASCRITCCGMWGIFPGHYVRRGRKVGIREKIKKPAHHFAD